MTNKTIYKIKNSVDLFLTDNCILTAYFINTRMRQTFRVNDDMIFLLEQIDGIQPVEELCRIMDEERDVDAESVKSTLGNLSDKYIITEVESTGDLLTPLDQDRYARQINYFGEFCRSEREGVLAQKRVMDSVVLIFGCGALGGTIALMLAMAGVQNITLLDYDTVESSDISRHMFFRSEHLGKKKTTALKEELLGIDSRIHVETLDNAVTPQYPIEDLICRHNLVINTLDEPYIGYTSSKISRVCVKHEIPHYIAGGFDAHLASTGELIIPHVTPCVECYASYFKDSLKDWKPRKHPVRQRELEIGGLASMSLFSSSYAGIEIMKYLAGITDLEKNYKIRGEFLFHDFSLTYLNIEKNQHCPVCGKEAVL